MKKLNLNDIKKIKYENGEWTLNSEKLFTKMLDEKYIADFKFNIDDKEYKADYIIYVYGFGPSVQYIDEFGNVAICPIYDLLNNE